MTALRVIVAVIAIAGIAWLIRWDRANPNVSFLASFFAAQIPSAIALFLIAYRTCFLSAVLVPLGTAFRGNALAVVGTLFLPARLGDIGKPFYFNALCGYPVSKGLVLVVEERIWDFVGLAALAILTLFLIGEQENSSMLLTASYLTIAIAVTGILCLIFVPKLVVRLPVLSRMQNTHDLFAVKSARHLFRSLLMSLLIWGASLAILVVSYSQSGLPELRLEQLMFLFIASTLGLVISVTPGSIGTYEGAIVAVLVGYGIDWDAALAFAIGFRLTWLALPVCIAGLAVLKDAESLAVLYKRKRT